MQLPKIKPEVVARRGELMAELFFEEFEPVFLSKPTSADVGYDLLMGFHNEKAGVNTFAVEIKAVEDFDTQNFSLDRDDFNRLANSNVPCLLIVADVKKNRLYYAWVRSSHATGRSSHVAIPMIEIDKFARRELYEQLTKVGRVVAVAG